MNTMYTKDKNYNRVEIGDVVTVIDRGIIIENGVVVGFDFPFVDPIRIQFAGGMTVSRTSDEISLVSEQTAVLWKLENL